MTTQLRKTGLGVLSDMPWGTHCCHFYQTQKELLETLVPYFKAGLESREFCFWLVPEPLTEAKARGRCASICPTVIDTWRTGASRLYPAGTGISTEVSFRARAS